MAEWLSVAGSVVTLTVHVQPGAKRTEVVGMHGDALKVRLAALPIDGRANMALIDLVAQRLGLARSAVDLKSGHLARRKVLHVSGAPADARQRLLGP